MSSSPTGTSPSSATQNPEAQNSEAQAQAAAREVLQEARSRGIQLWTESGKLRFRAPEGALDGALKKRLQATKGALLELLSAPAPEPEESAPSRAPWQPDPEAAHQPFPLTDIQQAYFIGRREELELGNLSPCLYMEISTPAIDVHHLGEAWAALCRRHPMLTASLLPDGHWQIPSSPPQAEVVPVVDLQDAPPAVQLASAEALRRRLGEEGPLGNQLATLVVTRLSPTNDRVHLCLSLLICDALSLRLLLREATWLYQLPPEADGKTTIAPERIGLEPLELSFRDYVLSLRRAAGSGSSTSPSRRRALEYWDHRLATLPPAPQLPLAQAPAALSAPRLRRLQATMAEPLWQRIRQRAREVGATPTAVVATAYARLLAAWARHPRFLLTVLFFDRRPIHAEVEQVFGNFSSTLLLEVEIVPGESFEATLKRLQERLWSDLEHAEVTGIEVLRRRRARFAEAPAAVAPVAFASTLGLEVAPSTSPPAAPSASGGEATPEDSDGSQGAAEGGEEVVDFNPLDIQVVDSRVQTPQVWLDHQVTEREGALFLSWDVLVELFPEGLALAAFDAYFRFLVALADEDTPWSQLSQVPLPEEDEDLLLASSERPAASDPEALAEALRMAAKTSSPASFEPAAAPVLPLHERDPDGPSLERFYSQLHAVRAVVADAAGVPRPLEAPGELLLGKEDGSFLATDLEARQRPDGIEVLGMLPPPLPREKVPPAGEEAVAGSAAVVEEEPQGETEESVAALWREVLDLERVGRHEAFFDLGGHSLAAVRLLGQVRKVFGVSLPLATLFEGGSVAALAKAIEESAAQAASSSAKSAPAQLGEDPLLPLRRDGDLPPLVLVHPIGGGALCYTPLGRELAGLLPQQPLWGLETPADAALTLEERAATYLEHLRAQGFAAPWRLGGWSLGALLAWEMARQLEAAGEAVEAVLMIDPGAPATEPAAAPEGAALAQRFLADLAALATRTAPPLALQGEESWDDLRQRALAVGRDASLPGSEDEETFFTLLERYRANAQALAAFAPAPRAQGVATLLMAAESEDPTGGEGWRELAPGATVTTLPGNHYTLVQPPRVRALARAVSAALSSVPSSTSDS
ncbi:MAG: thioesterase domain-containing protein [Acidobacteriota bacterium]